MNPTTPEKSAASPEVKSQTTPEAASAPVVQGTTARLFPDMIGTTIPGAPKKAEASEKPSVAPEPVKEEAAPQAQKVEEPAMPDVLDLTSLKGKKIKLIVDGKEELVDAEDAQRRLQLDSHLTQKSQRLAAQEKELAEKAKALQKPAEEATSPDEESILSDDPLMKKVLAKLEASEKELESLRAISEKQKYAEGVELLATHVKTTLGTDDFKTYLPKIEEWFRTLPPEQQKSSDNHSAFIAKYQELKLKDMIQGSHDAVASKKPASPSVERPKAAPMQIEGGGSGVRVPQASEANVRYQTALKKAVETGSTDDWANVLAIRREMDSTS